MANQKQRKTEAGWVLQAKLLSLLIGGAGLGFLGLFAPRAGALDERFQVPPGVVVEQVADPSLVSFPLFACFDDQGRLYVASGTGLNVGGPEIFPQKLGKISRLEDSDGDGRFDKSVVFADGLVFPQGVLWHDGAVYVASHPAIWRLEDTNGDGVADRREEFVGKFGFTGNGCDIHGPFVGPDGWIYWTEGRHGYKIHTKEGDYLEGMASRLWRSRFDGTRMERVAGGGYDNPVEITWTEDGDVIGTMDQWEGDALIHYVLGGVYPNARHPSIGEFPSTGRLLGFVTQFSPAFPAALCGITTLRTDHFGRGYKDTLLTTHFNVKRLQQHILQPQGATSTSVNKNFLNCTEVDFHPTDVLEDADGSLLVVDMGAWFTYGCPTAGLTPKPESMGGIYRVRNSEALPVQDPWGLSLGMETLTASQLVDLLGDARPKVRDRAVEQLVKRGPQAVAELAEASRRDGSRSPQPALTLEARRNTVWALSRIGTPEAREAVREALADKDSRIRYAAAHSVGLERDDLAFDVLAKMVVSAEPRLRLKAAEALGRLGRREGIPALLESLRGEVHDRFLEHALIYALMSIGDREATARALEDAHPRVRRAALLALDQMRTGPQVDRRLTASLQGGAAPPAAVNYETEVFMDGKKVPINSYRYVGDRPLSLEQIGSLMDTDDPDLREAGLILIERRAEGRAEFLAALRGWLKEASLSDLRKRALSGAVVAFSGEEEIQQLVAQTLSDPQTSPAVKVALVRAASRVPLTKLPPSWLEGLAGILKTGDKELRREVVHLVRSRRLSGFDEPLAALARQTELPVDLRVNALEAQAPRLKEVPAAAFDLLMSQLEQGDNPMLRISAARALGSAQLSNDQLVRLAGRVGRETALVVPLLTQAFGKSGQDESVGQALVASLLASPGADVLTTEEVEAALKGQPAEVQSAARPLFEKRASVRQQQRIYLTNLLTELGSDKGNIEAGEQVFFSARVGCYNCHSIGDKRAGAVGPDLLNVGRRRWTRGTLEKILFPNNLIVPHYRSYRVSTRKGKTYEGLIAREDGESIYLRSTDLSEVRLARADIERMEDLGRTVMPAGLEKRLTPVELSDLLEFLVANEG